MSQTRMPFTSAMARMSELLRSLTAFKRIPQAKLSKFVLDVYLVGLGVRTGFLFDTFSLSDPRRSSDTTSYLHQALTSLRQITPVMQAVVLICVTDSDDHFFVNSSLFLERFQEYSLGKLTTLPWVKFLSLSEITPSIAPIPGGTKALLSILTAHLSTHASQDRSSPILLDASGHNVPTMHLVPFTALLLDYPVAYVPHELSATSLGFLSGVELEVYSCTIEWEEEGKISHNMKTHTFLQFSCPQSTTEEIGDIASGLHERFAARFVSAGLQCKLLVTRRTECLDRVAL